jgi:hypothetical protein
MDLPIGLSTLYENEIAAGPLFQYSSVVSAKSVTGEVRLPSVLSGIRER